MTVAVCVLVPDGIVLAADSRQVRVTASGHWRVDSDQADKIFPLTSHISAVICGQSCFYLNENESPTSIGLLLQAERERLTKGCTVAEGANIIHESVSRGLLKHQDIVGGTRTATVLYVAGYDPVGNTGELYRCECPGNVTLERKTNDAGAVWNGQREFIDRLILGCDPRLVTPEDRRSNSADMGEGLHRSLSKLQLHLSFQTMALQDAVSLADLLTRVTIDLGRLSDGIVGQPGSFPTCGGAIDVAVISAADGFRWLRHKELSAGIVY